MRESVLEAANRLINAIKYEDVTKGFYIKQGRDYPVYTYIKSTAKGLEDDAVLEIVKQLILDSEDSYIVLRAPLTLHKDIDLLAGEINIAQIRYAKIPKGDLE